MPIKPIDFQVAIPRTVEISKLQNDLMQKHINSEQLEAIQIQNKALENTKLVQKREDTYKVTNREQPHEQKQKEGKKQGNYNKDKKEQKDGSVQSTIDIRL